MTSTASALATSPAFSPPIPSHTTSNIPRGPTARSVCADVSTVAFVVRSTTRKASSLFERAIPTSLVPQTVSVWPGAAGATERTAGLTERGAGSTERGARAGRARAGARPRPCLPRRVAGRSRGRAPPGDRSGRRAHRATRTLRHATERTLPRRRASLRGCRKASSGSSSSHGSAPQARWSST